tara:strand:- start:40 stop:591 length:552 start_codon:yes stop_codon:yes gene_type:complete
MRVSEVFLSACIIVVSFFGGVKYSLHKINKETSYWAKQYKETDDKVSEYIEVSDPKTVRSYIKQLNDMLDNMTRLGKIIESGQELDEALIDILNQQQKINKKLGDMVTLEEYKAYTVQNDFRLGASKHDDDDQFELIEELSGNLDKVNYDYMKKLEKIETELLDVQRAMEQIKNSKTGQRIFN